MATSRDFRRPVFQMLSWQQFLPLLEVLFWRFKQNYLKSKFKFSMNVIAVFSLSTLLGIYTGIVVSEYQLLTPIERRHTSALKGSVDNKYLRANYGVIANKIEDEVASGRKSYQKGFDELVALLKESK
ncbi:MAG: hypothetical protein JJE30_01770 [Desulfuromonadales bacterium]|nr:hypothetical protein [Desulfuromonadales bacterium]